MFKRFRIPRAPHGAPALTTDPAEIAELLAAVKRIPRSELPNGAARDALIEAIRCGEVDACYTPIGHTYHNVTLAGLPRDVDPRITVAQWSQWWDAGKSPSDELLAREREAQARGREMLRAWEARRQAEKGGQA